MYVGLVVCTVGVDEMNFGTVDWVLPAGKYYAGVLYLEDVVTHCMITAALPAPPIDYSWGVAYDTATNAVGRAVAVNLRPAIFLPELVRGGRGRPGSVIGGEWALASSVSAQGLAAAKAALKANTA